jgi:hypothetical protein
MADRGRFVALVRWAASRAWIGVALIVGLALQAAIFLPLIPTSGRGLGHDYELHFPSLLTGYFFELTNGPFSVPWFSAAECAGVPFLADLNVAYYSLPQWLTFLVDPLSAIRLTFLIFAALGALGSYLLTRRRFGASAEASLLAAMLFLFSAFWPLRMAIGHLTFHPFVLAPWFALIMLPRPDGGGLVSTRLGAVAAAILAGALTAYEFQAGMIHIIIPVAIAVTVIMLVHGHLFGHRWRPWLVFAAATILSVLLSASRLVAALAFVDQFPRFDYRLEGFPGLFLTIRMALEALFWSVPIEAVNQATVNNTFVLERNEFDYSVGPAAAVVLLAGAAALAIGWRRGGLTKARLVRAAPTTIAIIALLALPILVNWYTPGWNAVLKRLPVIGQSLNLFRWFSTYIPIIAVVAALALDKALPALWPRRIAGLVLIAATIGFAAHLDKSFYSHQKYNASLILASWRSVHTAADVPPILSIVVNTDTSEMKLTEAERENLLVLGATQLLCYQPMFGYGLEHFKVGWLRPGPILQQVGPDQLNLKNPACYVFPKENNCSPGDEFSPSQIDSAGALVSYKPFPFDAPPVFRIAGWVNLIALVGAPLVLIAIGAWRLRDGLSRRKATRRA